jgi:hypothetical protein
MFLRSVGQLSQLVNENYCLIVSKCKSISSLELETEHDEKRFFD